MAAFLLSPGRFLEMARQFATVVVPYTEMWSINDASMVLQHGVDTLTSINELLEMEDPFPFATIKIHFSV
jgi:hypothetical protein